MSLAGVLANIFIYFFGGITNDILSSFHYLVTSIGSALNYIIYDWFVSVASYGVWSPLILVIGLFMVIAGAYAILVFTRGAQDIIP